MSRKTITDKRREKFYIEQFVLVDNHVKAVVDQNATTSQELIAFVKQSVEDALKVFVNTHDPHDVELFLTGAVCMSDAVVKKLLALGLENGHLSEDLYGAMCSAQAGLLLAHYLAAEKFLPHLRSHN